MTKQFRILVVEDEVLVLDLLARELARWGFAFAGGARTGREAIELARTARPDVVLMDVHLDGDLDGIETARAIREFVDVPVVFATGDAMDETIEAAVKTGPYGYLTKPFDSRELKSTVQVAFHKHELDRRLAESEARYRTLTEALPQKVWTADHAGRAQFFNAEWVRYTGMTLERGQGEGWLAALHPLDAVGFTGQWEHVVGTGQPFERECRLKRATDGQLRWHLARAVPLAGSDGQRQWFGTFTDIEDEKLREAQVKLSEAQKRAVLEAALDAIITLDHEGRVLECNSAAEKIFGTPRYEALGMSFLETWLAPASSAMVRQRFRDHLMAVGDNFLGQRETVTGRRADGTEFPLEIGFARVSTVGQPVFTAFGRDLTERQRETAAQELLEREHAALQARHRAVLAQVPTCSECRAMQLPDGSWGDLDHFLREQGPATKATHLCPGCNAKLHPEQAEKKRFRLWSKEL